LLIGFDLGRGAGVERFFRQPNAANNGGIKQNVSAEFVLVAFGGNGITFSRMAAEIIRNTLTGRVDADAALFAFPAH
jgi:hypothetical protein